MIATSHTGTDGRFSPMIRDVDGRNFVLHRVSYINEDAAAAVAQSYIGDLVKLLTNNGWVEPK